MWNIEEFCWTGVNQGDIMENLIYREVHIGSCVDFMNYKERKFPPIKIFINNGKKYTRNNNVETYLFYK